MTVVVLLLHHGDNPKNAFIVEVSLIDVLIEP